MCNYNIKRPFLNIIQDMYQILLSSIKTANGMSGSFETKIGVKQGCDDTVLLSKTAKGLQLLLHKLEDFCIKWNLKVNTDKTKIIIFNKSDRVLKGYNFFDGNNLIEHANEYKYSGIYFRPSGVFTQGIKYLCNKALKGIFCIRKALMSECMNTYVRMYV